MQAGNTLDNQLAATVEVFESGELKQALQMAQELCRRNPDVSIVHNVHGVIAAEQGEIQAAIDSYQKAIALDPGNSDTHFNLGNALRAKGDVQAALSSYHAALELKPNDPDFLFSVATVLRGRGEFNEAEKLFRHLLELSPDDHTAHNGLGWVLLLAGRADDAISCFRHAVKLQPDFAKGHDNLCEALEKTNRTDELKEAVAHARSVFPLDNIWLAIRQAQVLRRDNDLEEAFKALSSVVRFNPAQAQMNSTYWYLLGDINDRLGNLQAAYEAFATANTWAAKTATGRRAQAHKYIQRLDDLQTAYKGVRRMAPDNSALQRGAPKLVFLIGFPRSGTTLLDTVLLSHSKISVAEEKPMVLDMLGLVGTWQPDQIHDHEQLTDGQVSELRDAYMTSLKQHMGDQPIAGQVIIDKVPLNITNVGLISRVFPDARFLLVLRHPCDCVLSCFMQQFGLNDAMANFLDLKSAAQCYDKVMSLWTTYREALPLRLHTVKYEQVVADLEGTVSQVLEFVGLDWEDAMADYKATALERQRIGTPSYHQVVQPLYNRAKGRWQRYRAQMEPVLPVLSRWVEMHGYPVDDDNR